MQSNVSAVNRLVQPHNVAPRKQDGLIIRYKIRDTEIIHCYDLPHLLKVIRNNLMTKDLEHSISKRWNISDFDAIYDDDIIYTADWNDIADVYDLDLKGSQRLLRKITNEHINPNRLKMKVCVAGQVFSQSFANVMLHYSEEGYNPKDCFGTAQALFFFNDLFDSLNGSGDGQQDTLFGSVNEKSIHFVYWEYALKMLSKMTFVNRETGCPNNRSSVLLKFMSTIRGYIELTRICLNLNMKDIALRYIHVYVVSPNKCIVSFQFLFLFNPIPQY